MTTPFEYAGSELDLFSGATNWRSYWASHVQRHLGSRVLEVGAGIGSVTRALKRPDQHWTALEPDPAMADRIREIAKDDPQLDVRTGSIRDLPPDPDFDTVLYIDVLEHIADDVGEVKEAYERLSPGGRLVVLAPAHQWLFTPFDAAIGHERRYSLSTLRALQPAASREVSAIYLDSAGILASAGNRLLLRSAHPTREQIGLWDTRLVPVSRRVDGLLGHRLGKTVVIVWQRPGSAG